MSLIMTLNSADERVNYTKVCFENSNSGTSTPCVFSEFNGVH